MKIVLVAVLAFLILGCSDSSKKEETKVVETPKVEVEKSAIVQIKEDIKEVTKSTKVSVIDAVDSLKEKTKDVVSSVKDSASEVKDTVVAQTIDGKALSAGCMGCHGTTFEKKALGKSAVIKDWDSAKIEDSLNGYKDGSYGGSMKDIMKGQVAKLNGAETKAIADYIANL